MAIGRFREGHWQRLQTCHMVVGPSLLRTLLLLHSGACRSENCSGLEAGKGIGTFIWMAALRFLTPIYSTEWAIPLLAAHLSCPSGCLQCIQGFRGQGRKSQDHKGAVAHNKLAFRGFDLSVFMGGRLSQQETFQSQAATLQRGGRQENSQGRGNRRGLRYLGHVTQQHSRESLGQGSFKGSQWLWVFYSPRICLVYG